MTRVVTLVPVSTTTTARLPAAAAGGAVAIGTTSDAQTTANAANHARPRRRFIR